MRSIDQKNLGILKKFNRPGPRYTSYPTAPMFSAEFTDTDFANEITQTNSSSEQSADLSLYLHFPFCEKLCYFCGCNMLVTHDRQRINTYNSYLKKEIDLLHPMISADRNVAQMHWGGGTPSYLTPDEIIDVGEFMHSRFNFDGSTETSVEIDPRGLTKAHMEAFRTIGVNRTSLGVQDFNPRVQEAINREQSEEITRQTVEWSRELGFGSINLDLIYGLPHQSLDSFAKTVDTIIDISPDRIAVFNYAHVPWLKKHQNVMDSTAIPSPDERLEILVMTIETLIAAGYVYIGMDHFSKPTDELAIAQANNTLYRNFQGYSTRAGCDVYAFGMSAISQFKNIYAQNLKSINDYYARIDEKRPATNVGYRMTADDHIRKETIMQLMCHLEIDKASIERQFDIQFDKYFAAEIAKLKEFEEEGFVSATTEKISIIGSGILVIRNIAMCFDAYLEQMIKEKPIFSKTV